MKINLVVALFLGLASLTTVYAQSSDEVANRKTLDALRNMTFFYH